jgi:hypothetical protein
MLTTPFEAKRAAARPVLSSTPVKHPPSVAAVHFGADKDSAQLKTSLPDWAKKVKDPATTIEKIMNIQKQHPASKEISYVEALKAYKTLISEGIKFLWARHKIDSYLPKEAKKDLRIYHLTPKYWFARIFNPKKAKVMDVTLAGPLAIKAMQDEVAKTRENKESLEKNLEDWKKQKVEFHQKPLKQLGIYFKQRPLKRAETYAAVLNNVPALPYKKFEKQLNNLKETYNKKHPDDPVTEINKKSIKAGSIGQVYAAKTKSGKQLVFKMIKPNLTKDYLNGYLPYLYYKKMVAGSTSSEAKQAYAKDAQSSVDILLNETKPEQEAENTKKIQQEAKRLQLNTLKIPDILAHTKDGLVLPLVGDKDFADISSKELISTKAKIGPDLARFILLSKEKPLDIHDGNKRTGQPGELVSWWLDHGRQFGISADHNQKLLKLMTAAYLVDKDDNQNLPDFRHLSDWEKLALQQNVRKHLQALLSVSPAKTDKDAIHKMQQLDSIPNLAELAARKAKLAEELANNEYKKEDKRFGVPHSDPLSAADEKKKKDELKALEQQLQPLTQAAQYLSKVLGETDTSSLEASGFMRRKQERSLHNIQPAVMNAWASAAHNLPGFANKSIPLEDIKHYTDKINGFFRPYVNQEEASASANKHLEALSIKIVDALSQETGTSLTENERRILTHNVQEGLTNEVIYRKY